MDEIQSSGFLRMANGELGDAGCGKTTSAGRIVQDLRSHSIYGGNGALRYALSHPPYRGFA